MSSTRTMTSYKPLPPSSTSSSSSSSDIKETGLSLGLPGTEFQDRKRRPSFGLVSAFGFYSGDEDTRIGISLNPTRNSGLGTKRGFFDAIDGCCGNGERVVVVVFDRDEGSIEWEKAKNDLGSQQGSAAAPPAAKAQIIGWPPIRSFRKNTTATDLAKNNEFVEGKLEAAGCLYVKVSMDNAPYLRKVDLKNYKTYAELLTALKRMFSGFTIGEVSSQKQLSDPVSSSEYVVTYEDKDGDWMLVGDVPWRMFAESCRRMRIMKGS